MNYIPDPSFVGLSVLISVAYAALLYTFFMPKRKDGITWDMWRDALFMRILTGILVWAMMMMLADSGAAMLHDFLFKGCGSLCT